MTVALPELPDDRRAQPGRHSRNDDPSGTRDDRMPWVPAPTAPGGPALPATSWRIDGTPTGSRLAGSASPEHGRRADGFGGGRHGTDGYGTNGYGTNGYGTNGYGTNGYDDHEDDADGHGGSGPGADGYGADGYGAERHDANGYGARDHGVDGHGANGYATGGPDVFAHDPHGYGAGGLGLNGRSNGGYPVAEPDQDAAAARDFHVATPPYGGTPHPSAADDPAPDEPRGRHSAGPAPEAVVAPSAHPDDGWHSGDAASTTPNGRPLNVAEDAVPDRPRPLHPDVPLDRSGHRHLHSDVPPPRGSTRPATPSAGSAVEPAPLQSALDPHVSGHESRRRRTPLTWPVRVRSGDPVSPAADTRLDDPPTVVLHALTDGSARGRDEPDQEAALRRQVDDVSAQDSVDDGPAGFPGRHRRRAGERPRERSGPGSRGGDGDAAEDGGAAEDPDARKGRGARNRGARSRDGRIGRRRRSSFWKELPILIVVALVLTFLIQTFLAKVYVIPSGSMETTLHGCPGCQNDRVLVDKVSYRFSDPAPGDVVVFRGPDGWTSEFTADDSDSVVVRALQSLGSLVGLAPPDEKDFIKRVIAVGGQTVQCCDSHNRVLVDGKPLDEPYLYFLPEAGSARQDSFGPVTVPAGELWVMGDSRNNSADSRVAGHGPVPSSDVIGRARLIVLPPGRFGVIPSPDPQTAAIGMASNDAGAPTALGVIALLPLALLRRRTRADDDFLPRRGT